MKHKVRRILSLASVLVLGGCAVGMFAGCTTQHPEVTITYSFNGKDYAVRYKLSRNDAPVTVQHFLELADAGYYDGMCIHDYQENAFYSGGYKLVNGELEEVNYFEAVKKLEEEKDITFTQSVWMNDEDKTPMYTIYGEFSQNGVTNQYARENRHKEGALVMYYTPKGKLNEKDVPRVLVERADGGSHNDGNATQLVDYATNSATALFYTYTGYSNAALDQNYCVFGMANEDDYEEKLVNGLFAAIDKYTEDLDEDKSFTEEITWRQLNQYEPFNAIVTAGEEATYLTPVEPIIIKSVKVNKY